jgi:hypothetical protein
VATIIRYNRPRAKAASRGPPTYPPSDFDFLHHAWTVSHRRLATRLAGAGDWYSFPGTSLACLAMNGFGNIEDNFLDDPDDAYHVTALRSFEAQTGLWCIWWLDLRYPGRSIRLPLAGSRTAP